MWGLESERQGNPAVSWVRVRVRVTNNRKTLTGVIGRVRVHMKTLTGVMVRKDVTRPLSADSVDTYDSTA